MYSNKTNVNILTALLVSHGVRHAVVCPGSRNAPIVHNLNECPDITCHPVTDERSAGFYALGMVQATGQPVVVCVTSGTALLNLAPAVAEAYYQRQPLVVVSADRPPQWIDQYDGQTLPQPDALGRFVRKAVTLPEVAAREAGQPGAAEAHWHCNRLVNEALVERRGPVHINVPISEPLFGFDVAALPCERRIELTPAEVLPSTLGHVARMFMQSKRPMLISGQPMNPGLDEAVCMVGGDERYVPDFVLCTSGAIVSKRLKHFLRKARQTWLVSETGEVADTFMNLTHVVQGDGAVAADYVRFMLESQPHPFVQLWQELLLRVQHHADTFEPDYSQMAVVKHFERACDPLHASLSAFHYANSMAIRLANIYARHPVCCNRGVNGIEGSLSTAAGFSLIHHQTVSAHSPARVFCVIGDLSFFYDQNALWNQDLHGNLRILLLNNGRGGIFSLLPGLEQTPARDKFVAAEHTTTAEGICRQNAVRYLKAENMDEVRRGVDLLLNADSDRPMLLEVFTNADDDERAYRAYYQSL